MLSQVGAGGGGVSNVPTGRDRAANSGIITPLITIFALAGGSAFGNIDFYEQTIVNTLVSS